MNHSDNDLLIPIYDAINFQTSAAMTIHCERCSNIRDIAWPPTAGSYPSSLFHYEAVLGRLAEPRTEARILFILEAPRADENNFDIVHPQNDVSALGFGEHRYFCLSQLAWENLKLDRTVSAQPCWPTRETAPYFLRRYLYNAGWSYDGLLAYFLYLFRPQTAVITNLAKCHFGESQRGRETLVFDRCASLHLENEARLVQPNLVISFSKKCDQNILNQYVPSLRSVPRLNLYHPAARGRVQPHHKRQRFLAEIETHGEILRQLGYDILSLQRRWAHDVDLAKSSR